MSGDGSDLWEFVHCAVCFTFWEDPPTVPFWASGCGHIICNDHLRSDGVCAACGDPGTEFVAVKKHPHEPIAHWFQPVSKLPHSSILASRFQVEMLASLVRHYRREAHKHQALIKKSEEAGSQIAALIVQVKNLQSENKALRTSIAGITPTSNSRQHGETYAINANGKRQKLNDSRPSPSISLNSVPNPVQPNRLTLSKHQQPAAFSASDAPPPSHSSTTGSEHQRIAYNPGQSSLTKQLRHQHHHPADQPSKITNHLQSVQLPRTSHAHNTTEDLSPSYPVKKNMFIAQAAPFPRAGGVHSTMPIAPTPSRPFADNAAALDQFSSEHHHYGARHASHIAPASSRHDQTFNTEPHGSGISYHPHQQRHPSSTTNQLLHQTRPRTSRDSAPNYVDPVTLPQQSLQHTHHHHTTRPHTGFAVPSTPASSSRAHHHHQPQTTQAQSSSHRVFTPTSAHPPRTRPSTTQPQHSTANANGHSTSSLQNTGGIKRGAGDGSFGGIRLPPTSNTTQARFKPVNPATKGSWHGNTLQRFAMPGSDVGRSSNGGSRTG
ncbi:hypothetical protein DL93DRAFT_2223986 [Clavulina sp. PMI_390]|nr:hypothetical protein DL93DRAFT_2223986 [Clavulina sp. PMI_390]